MNSYYKIVSCNRNFQIMGKTTSFILGEKLDILVQKEVESGEYKNASEVVREGLRLLFEKRRAEEKLINMIEEAEKSGYQDDFNSDAYLKNLKNKYLDK